MCVIIHVPANVVPDEELLKRCFDANPHGWGIMFAFQDELVSFKDKSDFNNFLEYWRTTPQSVDRFVHFRIKTHGETNAENCHPFSIKTEEQEFLMMHNGIVDVSEIDPDRSDTWHFSKLLSGMYYNTPDFLESGDVQKQLAKASTGSRLVFLRKDGKWYKFGTWSEKYGMTFSNLVFDYKTHVVTGGRKSSFPASDRAPYYGAYGCYGDWYNDDDYDSWGNLVGSGKADRPGDDPSARKTSSYTPITQHEYAEDYKRDTFEEGLTRIDEAIEDCDFDDAVALSQFHKLHAGDIAGWFGQAAADVLFDHILDNYLFPHSSEKGA